MKMTPNDFHPVDYWNQSARPIYKLTHPDDPVFGAEVHLSPPGFWRWRAHGRFCREYGEEPRKRRAMWAAIHALNDYYTKSTTPCPTPPTP